MDIKNALNYVDRAYILSLRHQLHMYPELAFDLPKTLALIRQELESLSIPYTEQYGQSSIVAFINPDCTGPSFGLRADTDALPLQEKTNLPYASRHNGIMHACGHDAHAAMLLGAAKALKAVETELTCKVVLLFQACEEGELSGAKLMVRDGIMEQVDLMLGMHIENWLETGSVGICPGTAMAASHPLHIEFFGKTAHATLPQSGCDALSMAVETFNGINALKATQLDPFEKYVCSVGMLAAGTTDNVIPDYAQMKISLRTFSTETESFIVQQIRTFAEAAAQRRGGSVTVHEDTKALPLVNDPALSQLVLESAGKVVGEDHIVTMPIKLSSEDFSFYAAEKPAAFIRLGTRNVEKGCTTLPHNNDFMLDEDALELGSRIFVQFVLDYMGGLPQ